MVVLSHKNLKEKDIIMMMNYDSISIVIPTLNEELNLERCLSSIFKQKFNGRIEVLVIDGGSTDRTLEIAKKFKVKFLKNPIKDAESAKLIGLQKSKSNYFMILDADMDFSGNNYLNKLSKPLKEDPRIIGAFGKYVSYPTDSFLSRYISLDIIQRDPLFRFLTVDPENVLKEKRNGYWLCEYSDQKIVPNGFSIYRRQQLIDLKLDKRHKFMELDTLSILVKNGFKYFAFVPTAKLHHPFLKDLKMLIHKRIRNLKTQFFNQLDKREFTWINFERKRDIFKIFLWIVYANSIILPTIVGFWRMFRYKTLIALYEPIFTWVTTNLIIVVFLTEKEGRKLMFKSIFK